jgi:hypothetical protein
MALPRLRAPQIHQGLLAVPPLSEALALLRGNQALWSAARLDVLGRSLAELRIQAGSEIAAAAHAYLSSLDLSPPVLDPGRPLIMTGHQPELFHPGVWVKNFAAWHLARAAGGAALNLIVDNDLAKSTAVQVPVRDGDTARLVSVPYDHHGGPRPYEELPVRDPDRFARFPAEVEPLTRGWGFTPILPRFWERAVRLRERTPLLGDRLAGARRHWEEQWGYRNAEVPVSRLCRTAAFAWFACHLLADLPRFRQVHNEELLRYRRLHGIRSRRHPVPDLALQDDRLEAPFWVWRAGEPRRDRLFVRRTAAELELHDRQGVIARLPRPERQAALAVEAWQQLERGGIKVRTRALTTTLYARLFLADLFLHGIGGGRYDELTDGLLRGFYGIEPPAYLVLSATLYLPLPAPPAPEPPLPALRRRLRDLWYNPDRHLPAAEAGSDGTADLVRRKHDLIGRQPETPADRRQRFRALRDLNERLRTRIEPELERWRRRESEAETWALAQPVLRSREYAFCLFPEEELLALVERVRAGVS